MRNIERIGLAFIFGSTSEETLANAELLVRTIKGLDWLPVPAADRNFPDNTGEYTPVYDGGDWVKWDPVAWEAGTVLDGYRGEDDMRCDHQAVRGPRLSVFVKGCAWLRLADDGSGELRDERNGGRGERRWEFRGGVQVRTEMAHQHCTVRWPWIRRLRPA